MNKVSAAVKEAFRVDPFALCPPARCFGRQPLRNGSNASPTRLRPSPAQQLYLVS